MTSYICVVILLICLFIIYNYSDLSNHQENNYMTNMNIDFLKDERLYYLDGYWISNPEFNKNSDIDNMILYIDFMNKTGYLLIIFDNKVVSKNEINLYIDEDTLDLKNSNTNIINYKCRFTSSKKEFIWNKIEFSCILNILTGNIKLFNNNILYADLFKDNLISSYINSI